MQKIVVTANSKEELRDKYHATLKQYRAEAQPAVSVPDGQIFYSRPIGKWMLARMKGNKITITFSDDCPCKSL